MGNQSTKHRAKWPRSAGPGRQADWHLLPRINHVLPAEGDVVYPVKEVLEVSEGALDELRQLIARDPEAFVLDNLLMATQYFENYEKEVRAARAAWGRGAPLANLPLRVLHAGALAEVAARHVQRRVSRVEPDQRLAAARHLLVSDNVTVHASAASLRHATAGGVGHGAHYHLAMEPGVKPGFVKLRRVHVQHVTSEDLYTITEDKDDTLDGLRVWESGPRPALGRRTPRTPSPRQGRSTDSVISSDESQSWRSDSSPGRHGHEHEKRVPLEEFRGRTRGDLRSPPDPRDLPRDCFQAVQTLRAAPADPDVDDEDAPPPPELHTEWYLMAHPFVVRFAHAFHQTLAAALGVPAESAHQAVVRVNNGPAGVLWERLVGAGAGAGGCQLQQQHEVVAALALADWPACAREWVVRERGRGWPARDVVRAVHDLGCVAVAAVPSGSDAHTLQWALAFPAGEGLLELSMSAPQAHAYLSLAAVLRAVPGINEALIRAFFMRFSESTPADVRSAASSLGWAPGRSLRTALGQLYAALRQQQLPDYFVTERNLLRELSHKQILRAQERLLRVQEQLVYRVLQTCRRLVYVHGDDFYQRLQYDKLVVLLAEPGSAYGSSFTTPSHSLCSSASNSRKTSRNEPYHPNPYGSSFATPSHSLCSSASNSRKTSRNEPSYYPHPYGPQGQAPPIVINTNWADMNGTRSHQLASAASSPGRSRRTSRTDRSHNVLSSVNQKWIDELRRRDAEERSLAEAAAATTCPKLDKHLKIKLGMSSPEARYRTQGLLKLFCDQFIEMGKTSLKFKDYSQAYVYLRHSLHLLTILEQDYGYIKDARDFLGRVKQAERELTRSTILTENVRTKPIYGRVQNLSSYNQQRQCRGSDWLQ